MQQTPPARPMYLKELRIQGFKSFADPTVIPLGPGVTAIVGPNGCGKSNIADALRWVLGEQSTKSLRADAMADVIFQGCATRKALSLCEVSLLFADCENALGTSFNELEITRRVTRDGSSNYFINGRSARLKDIMLLFMGTGVGQVSYSFLLQGRIDQILSSNPAERRAIFEEASGISRYKTQRKEAMDKLRGVEADLARVSDVLDEVSKRIGTLRRQAAKAIRHRMISERATNLEMALAARRRVELDRAISDATALVEGARTKMLTSRNAMESLSEQSAETREKTNAAAEALADSDRSIAALRSERDRALTAAETAAVRKSDCEAHLKSIRAEIEEMSAEMKGLEEKARQRREIRELQMKALGNGDEELASREKELGEMRKTTDAAVRELAGTRQALMASENALSRLRTDFARISAQSEASAGRAAALDEEIRQAGEELGRERAAAADTLEKRKTLEQKQAESAHALDEARKAAAGVSKQLQTAQETQRNAERELAGFEARVRTLEEVQKRMEGFSDGAKAIVQGRLNTVVPAERTRLLLPLMDVEEKWAPAVELLLGQGADAVALGEAEDLPKLRSALLEKKLGNACLILPAANGGIGEGAAPHDDAEFRAVAASDVVRARSAGDAALMNRLFSGCILFETLDDFILWHNARPGAGFSLAATLDGCTVDRRGMVFLGGNGQRDSFLLRESRLRRLHADLDKARARTESLKADVANAAAANTAAGNIAEEARRAAAEVAHELASLRGLERGLAERVERAEQREKSRLAEKERMRLSDEAAAKKLEQTRSELEADTKGTTALRDRVAEQEAALAELRKKADVVRENFESLRLDVAGRKQRLEIAHREVAEVERAIADGTVRRQKREGEAGRDEKMAGELAVEIASNKESAAMMEKELKAALDLHEERRDALSALQRKLQTLESEMELRRREQNSLVETLTQREVALVKLQGQMEALAEEVQRGCGANLKELDWRRHMFLAGEPLPERVRIDVDDDDLPDLQEPAARQEPSSVQLATVPGPDWAEVRAEAEELRRKIDAMGAVNMLAIEEYRDLRQRHEFLHSQSEDLWQARERLTAAIEEINSRSTELFRETFEKVKVNFTHTFTTLFGGGEAGLELVDSDDVLESGVEISARPPGTRLRSVALLSGGQRTMTAMALLFAIYMVKPSPFCVLDEIDAPLDEANVGRFSTMLEEFLHQSQFFIISHNKHTIATASTIYGVTMEERGVSKIVSMKMEKSAGSGAGLNEETTARVK